MKQVSAPPADVFSLFKEPPAPSSFFVPAPTGKAAKSIQKLADTLKVAKTTQAKPDWKDSVFPLEIKVLEQASDLPSIEERLKEMQRKIEDATLGPFKVHYGIDPASKTGSTIHRFFGHDTLNNTWLIDEAAMLQDVTAFDAPWPSPWPAPLDAKFDNLCRTVHVAPRQAGKSRLKEMVDKLYGFPVTSHKAQGKTAAEIMRDHQALSLRPYQKDMMRWLAASPLKYMDTKMSSIHHDMYGRHGRASDRYEVHVREFIHKNAHHFAPYLPERTPTVEEMGPMANLFLWGPDGEWTGLWAIPDAELEKTRDYDGYYDLGNIFEAHADMPIMKVGGDMYYRRRDRYGGYGAFDEFAQLDNVRQEYDRQPLHQRFCTLEAWTTFQGTIVRDSTSTDVPANVRYLQKLLQQMSVDAGIMAEWTGLMAKTKFGFGVLRDGKDRYDPFGVLALMHNAQWTWDEAERGWAINGSCYDVEGGQILSWLGGSPRAVKAAQAFVDAVTEFSDGQKSFKPLIKLLADVGLYHAAVTARYGKFRDRLQQQAALSDREFGGNFRSPHYDYGGGRRGRSYAPPEETMEHASKMYHNKYRYNSHNEYQRHRLEMDLLNPRYEAPTPGVRSGKLDGSFIDMEPEILNPDIFDDA
ncbi:hypothetical protein D869_gp280 [Caulobacter phage CcrRogue]|uniref:Uncharacterized protein n=1 Tax=Caulobacter phage CcrRogue TaxID=2927986 RepID=K4JN44_9CAUD|nr:hypothetical protein D869_gp280 [Caulobacter phage CcrRogue]AFU86634.1 hypothetical protein CcrRogue_gp152 [Caulobacter phage CcrRogue]